MVDVYSHRGALGRWGEWCAEFYLRSRRFQVLARNFETPFAEVDRICLDGPWLVVCEVKARRLRPERWVEPDQLRRLNRAAIWLDRKYGRPGSRVRVDLVALEFASLRERWSWRRWVPRVEHVRGISCETSPRSASDSGGR